MFAKEHPVISAVLLGLFVNSMSIVMSSLFSFPCVKVFKTASKDVTENNKDKEN